MAGSQLFIKKNDLDVQFFCQQLKFLHLTASDKGARIDSFQVLGQGREYLNASGFGKQFQFSQRILEVKHLGGGWADLDANQYRFFWFK